MVGRGKNVNSTITGSAPTNVNTLENYIEDKRLERQQSIKARRNRTAQFREKINSIANK